MNSKTFLSFYVIIPVICLALYLHGFFPLKTSLSGHAELKNVAFNDKILSQSLPVFDKLVIILIDALRSDFVFENSSMKQLAGMLASGRGVGFVVKAHPPTVTMPRIKAITTGTIPGFIDVVLNFDSSALEEDNLVTQMKRAGKRIIFYGDDTWLRLFLDHFIRSDGTTSFFVSDYTQVDDNVTRHLDAELTNLDWDMMILHYLGLDHIGHLEGPHSPLMKPKLEEMDGVIHKIYTALEKQSDHSLILVCGDHGMSDHGGHGGASDSEILVPAVFISPHFRKKGSTGLIKPSRSLFQIDLAPTLSALMGLPITNNNLGQILTEVLEAGEVDLETVLELLYFNTLQVVQLMEANIPSYKYEPSYEMFVDVTKLHGEFLNKDDKEKAEVNGRQLLYLYQTTLEAMTNRISASLTKYDMYQMTVAPVVMLLAFVAVMLKASKAEVLQPVSLETQSVTVPAVTVAGYLLWHVMACSSVTFHSAAMCSWSQESVLTHLGILITIVFVSASIKCLLQTKSSSSKKWELPDSSVTTLLLVGSLLHSVTYVSSSNVEEEHQTCYFLVTTFFCLNTIRTGMIYLQQVWKLKHTKTCACGEVSYKEQYEVDSVKIIEDSDMKPRSTEAVKRFMNEVDQLRKEFDDLRDDGRDRPYIKDTNIENSETDNQKQHELRERTNITAIDFPLKELFSSVVILMILRVLRSLNQTGNKWLDRPDIADWLARSENRTFLSVVVVAALIVLWVVIARKYTFSDAMMVGIAVLSCYRYRAKTGAIDDFLNQVTTVDKKYIGTIQFMIVYGIGSLLIFRNILDLITNRITGRSDEKIKANVIRKVLESIQQTFLLMIAILLRTHNILYVVGLGCMEMLIDEMIPSIISLPVPYLTLFCLWLGRASFYFQGNSNSLSSIDVAAGYAGHPYYQETLVTIQLFLTTYAGPVFWFIVLLKYLYFRSLRCDTGDESLSARLKTGVSVSVLTLVMERLFTLLVYTTVTTLERYHLFVWTVFSPKLLYEGMFTLLSAMIKELLLALLRHEGCDGGGAIGQCLELGMEHETARSMEVSLDQLNAVVR